MRLLPIVLLATFFGCGKKDKNIEDYRPQLMEINVNSHNWASRNGLSATVEPDITGSVDDAGTFDGFLCFSGEGASARAIEASQGPDGRMWRAPAQVGTGTYSRDAAVGQLACFLRTENRDALTKWVGYIESQGGRLCPSGEGDCEINFASPLWSCFAQVFKRLGLPLTPRLAKYQHNHLNMALTVPTTSGYRTHLLGMEVMILQAAGEAKIHTSALLVKQQPENPLYHWLNGEFQKSAELTARYCPRTRPGYRSDWIFQRDAPYDMNKSSGWDCIGMTNVLLGR